MAETIRFLAERGVPVMAHVGLTPQSVNALGCFRAQGRDAGTGRRSRRTPARCGGRRVLGGGRGGRRAAGRGDHPRDRDPHIGIGASAACDGQVLVLEDMLGLSPWVPKFVKRYATLGPSIEAAVSAYADEVRSRAFPGPANVYPLKAER